MASALRFFEIARLLIGFSPTSRGIKQSLDPLDRGNTLLREFGGVADRLAGLKQPRNVAMLVQQLSRRQNATCGPAQFLALTPSLSQPGHDTRPEQLEFAARHLSQKRQHDAGRWIAFPTGQQRFDALGVPVKRDAALLELFHEAMRYAVPSRNS